MGTVKIKLSGGSLDGREIGFYSDKGDLLPETLFFWIGVEGASYTLRDGDENIQLSETGEKTVIFEHKRSVYLTEYK